MSARIGLPRLRRLAPALAALALAAPAAPAAEPEIGRFGDPMRGQTLFVSKGCVSCHAVRGSGGRVGPDLGRAAVKGSFAEIAAGMWNHSLAMDEKMREFRVVRPTFEGDELSDLFSFLYFLNYFDEPGDPQAGKLLFSQKHCIQCHRLGVEGGTGGPRLDALTRETAPLWIAQKLWNHGPVMIPAIRRLGLNVPQFQGTEILDLFAYLRSQGRRGQARDFHSAGDAQRGRKLFSSKGCARCHGVFGDDASMGPDLGRAELRGSVTQLAGRMWNHWAAMAGAMDALGMRPPTFEENELADIFAYIFISRYGGASGGRARGEHVYRQKECAACHGPRGEGGLGPALDTATAESQEQVFQRMWNHAPKMSGQMGARRIPWPRFDAAELEGLLALLRDGWPAAGAAAAEKTR